MRVIHLIDSGGYYGAERVLLELLQAQRAAGIDASLISHGDGGCGAKAIEREAEARQLPLTIWRGDFLRRLRQLVATSDKDTVLHSHGYKFTIVLALLPRRCTTVATVHGYTELRLYRKMGIYALLDRWALRRLDGAAFVAAKVAADARIRLDGRRYQQIANGIDAGLPMLQPLPVPLAAAITGKQVVLSLGRLSPEKGLAHLLRAFARIHGRHPDALLVIAGEGQLQAELEALAGRLGISGQVYFAGYIAAADSLLAAACLLAQPSLTEGMPMTVLEAMRRGVPVVASAVGSLPELLGPAMGGEPAGLLVTAADDAALAVALERLLTDPAVAQQLGAQGKQRFLAHYSSAAMAARYQDFYQQCRAAAGLQ